MSNTDLDFEQAVIKFKTAIKSRNKLKVDHWSKKLNKQFFYRFEKIVEAGISELAEEDPELCKWVINVFERDINVRTYQIAKEVVISQEIYESEDYNISLIEARAMRRVEEEGIIEVDEYKDTKLLTEREEKQFEHLSVIENQTYRNSGEDDDIPF